ncbi:hypothetical protein [uncultured Ruminococcus sp.]|uniref:hypothetical protein n=1 Tax=uncultured Ruminococcus sp. TaxID=165186 RepID=UPI0025EB020F|nr:hypothetical protein [uncultured Ruminococcus sp.]
MIPTLTLTDVSGSTLTEAVCLSFRLEKERYTPFTALTARFLTDSSDFGNPASVAFRLDDQLLHQGILDTLTVTKQKGIRTVEISSRGFTSLLMQNQMAAGMLTGVTLQSLMEQYAVPGVTYESGVTQTNYVWVKEGTSQWDAIVNYGYKYNRGYPYISGANEVRLTRKAAGSIAIEGDALLAAGGLLDYTRMVSHIHMADAEGNPDAFSLENPEATARNISRHRQIPLDLQYAAEPEACLEQKLRYSMRGCSGDRAVYPGYHGEDLERHIILGSFAQGYISRLVITGAGGQIRTEVYLYRDKFCNLPESE